MHRVIGERGFDETPFSEEVARDLLCDMIRARAFDERALTLRRRGWLSGYRSFRGREASQVAAAHAMADEDWLFPTRRSNAMQIARGVPTSDLLLFGRGNHEHLSDHDVPNFPRTAAAAAQIPHAAGAGMAMDYRDDGNAAVAYFGDGATSAGAFHEGMNVAGVFGAPVCFFCETDDRTVPVPRERRTASESIAVKADAYGFAGGRVDGNDPLAVREFVGSALARVRDGDPVLVESLTCRQEPDATSDGTSRSEGREADPEWRTRDPLDRYEEYLVGQGVVDGATRSEFAVAAEAELDEAVERAESEADPDLGDLFDHVFAEPTPRHEEQRARLREHAEEHGLQGVER